MRTLTLYGREIASSPSGVSTITPSSENPKLASGSTVCSVSFDEFERENNFGRRPMPSEVDIFEKPLRKLLDPEPPVPVPFFEDVPPNSEGCIVLVDGTGDTLRRLRSYCEREA